MIEITRRIICDCGCKTSCDPEDPHIMLNYRRLGGDPVGLSDAVLHFMDDSHVIAYLEKLMAAHEMIRNSIQYMDEGSDKADRINDIKRTYLKETGVTV